MGHLVINFFLELRQARVPVSLREYLTLLEAMGAGVADYSVDDFLFEPVVSREGRDQPRQVRPCLRPCLRGLQPPEEGATMGILEEWLRKISEHVLSEEEKALVEALRRLGQTHGGTEKRLEEQKGRHQGGSKWIGTAEHPRSALTATIPKACASAKKKTGTTGR